MQCLQGPGEKGGFAGEAGFVQEPAEACVEGVDVGAGGDEGLRDGEALLLGVGAGCVMGLAGYGEEGGFAGGVAHFEVAAVREEIFDKGVVAFLDEEVEEGGRFVFEEELGGRDADVDESLGELGVLLYGFPYSCFVGVGPESEHDLYDVFVVQGKCFSDLVFVYIANRKRGLQVLLNGFRRQSQQVQ